MQKIGDSTSTANAEGEFREGNPGSGVDATLLKAAWFNAIQRELIGLIEGAGIVLDPADDTQVMKAVMALAGEAVTGYLPKDENAVSASKLATARLIELTGAATGRGTFDGSGDLSIEMTLSDIGVAPGDYSKVTINAKGQVIGSKALTQTDIPNLDWAKISSGKPTTLAGYKIGDAYTKKEVDDALKNLPQSIGVGQAWQDVTAGRVRDVAYTNTTGRAIAVSVWPSNSTRNSFQLFIDGLEVSRCTVNDTSLGAVATVTAIIPAGSSYVVASTIGSAIGKWSELR